MGRPAARGDAPDVRSRLCLPGWRAGRRTHPDRPHAASADRHRQPNRYTHLNARARCRRAYTDLCARIRWRICHDQRRRRHLPRPSGERLDATVRGSYPYELVQPLLAGDIVFGNLEGAITDGGDV